MINKLSKHLLRARTSREVFEQIRLWNPEELLASAQTLGIDPGLRGRPDRSILLHGPRVNIFLHHWEATESIPWHMHQDGWHHFSWILEGRIVTTKFTDDTVPHRVLHAGDLVESPKFHRLEAAVDSNTLHVQVHLP